MKKDLQYIANKKQAGVPITAVTAYDFPTARILDDAGIDIILVGDSLGTNHLGYQSEREVTLSDMAHHTAAVKRAVREAFIIADLPYGRTGSADDALWCAKILAESGADCVKVEGWGEKAGIVKGLREGGINVCAHIGYNPQIHDKPEVFGRNDDQAAALVGSAKTLCSVGASLIVLELIPSELAGQISKNLAAPTIGIGSGNWCDGQVLVVNDLLGLAPRVFKHARAFTNLRETMYEAFKDYIDAVRSREFPGVENIW